MIDSSLQQKQQEQEHPVLQELVRILAGHPGWKPLRDSLENGEEYVAWTANTRGWNLDQIHFKEGHGSHHLDGLVDNRSYHAYTQAIIEPLILSGEIGDGSCPGSYDDRKLRWSTTNCLDILDPDAKGLTLAVGPTWFQRCQVDIQRNPDDAIKLMLHGLQCHGDPYAFFARGMGIVVIPLTRDGHVFIGRRAHTSEYINHLCFVAGWLSFPADIKTFNLYSELERELEEEIHLSSPINPEQCKMIGLAGQPFTGETDLVFVVQTDLTDDHFSQDIWPEHHDWFAVRNRKEAEQLLHHGKIGGVSEAFNIMFSSRMGLELLVQTLWAK